MENLKLRKLVNCRILGGVLIGAALAVAVSAQAPRQLQVEVGPNQQVRILASDVSYGEVLRALQRKLGWEIQIPPLADELKLSYARIETTQPQEALRKLLEGSGLGYAFVAEGSRNLKVLVIPMAPRETKASQDTVSAPAIPEDAIAGTSLPAPDQVQTANTTQLDASAVEQLASEPIPASSTMPLSEAIKAIGAPPGVPLSDVGKAMTLPMSEAARIIGAPPGTSPGDVGKTITLPLPTGPGKHP